VVETSIGKMVPVMTADDLQNDMLTIFAEPYNTLILDKHGFRGSVPDVAGLAAKENIKAWVDRKAFIHNMGHATAAYTGNYYYPEAKFIHEVLRDKNILDFTHTAMSEAANVLINYYPDDFTVREMNEHIEDLQFRFQNQALNDTILRVGQDLPRKLAIDDRFAGIIHMARDKGLQYRHIVKAMAYGLFFSKESDQFGDAVLQDTIFIETLKEKGLEVTLTALCRFQYKEDGFIIEELKQRYNVLRNVKNRDSIALIDEL
jgi:mannitol-1-phosphate 5-dehydrogenase